MALAQLGWLLVDSGALVPEQAAFAERRRQIYGGGLDTVLLELRAVDEGTLRRHLGQATGLPVAEPPLAPAPGDAPRLSPQEAQNLRVVPIGRAAHGALRLAVGPDVDRQAVSSWAASAGETVDLVVVPEARFVALTCALLKQPLPPRYAALLAQLDGRKPHRRPRAREIPPPLVDTGPVLQRPPPATEFEIDLTTDLVSAGEAVKELPPVEAPAHADARPVDRTEVREAPSEVSAHEPANLNALPTVAAVTTSETGDAPVEPPLASHLPPPVPSSEVARTASQELRAAAGSDDPGQAVGAIVSLAEARDVNAIPTLLRQLDSNVPGIAAAARAALVTLARQDFQESRRRWNAWWERARGRHRIEWLLDALGHKEPELRLAASEELRELTGVYLGYHFDLPARAREEARQRWWAWWRSEGRARFAPDR
jgi:hypothetical protein